MKFADIGVIQYGASLLSAVGLSSPTQEVAFIDNSPTKGVLVDTVTYEKVDSPEYVVDATDFEPEESSSNVELITDAISSIFSKVFKTPYKVCNRETHRVQVNENGHSVKYVLSWSVLTKDSCDIVNTDEVFEEILDWSKARASFNLKNGNHFSWCESFKSNGPWIADVRFLSQNRRVRGHERDMWKIPCEAH